MAPELTQAQLELLATAKLLSEAGQGFVPSDDTFVVAARLHQKGWLEMRFVNDGDDAGLLLVQASRAGARYE